jgi:hypothetical protein
MVVFDIAATVIGHFTPSMQQSHERRAMMMRNSFMLQDWTRL